MRILLSFPALFLIAACSEPAETPVTPAALTSEQAAVAAVTAAATGAETGWSHGFMAAIANPYATEAAAEMLAMGGHAVDAAIAAHAVLGLVEPESSGIGGGGFMLVYEQEARQVRFFDGRETAPAGASADMFMNDDEFMGYLSAWQSGRSVGIPGSIALYKLMHDTYGKLDWATVLQPAIELASEGFAVPQKLADSAARIAQFARLDENPGAAEYFFPGGEPLQAGQLLRNPDYADTLSRIAEEGPAAFYTGEVAEAIVAAVQAEPIGGSMNLEDLANYRAVEREAVCGPWRQLTICSANPPSSGAMQIMMASMYDHLLPEPASLEDQVRAFVDAQRLAYADRDYYFGDPDQIDVPVQELLNPSYLEMRAQNPAAPDAIPLYGDPASATGGDSAAVWGADRTVEPAGTTHFSIVDNEGNAVAATMTVESPFGSSRWAAGFLLNNELTDFAREYDPEAPEPANMIRPGARPRSSMSPTILLDAEGDLFMVTGSPGGNSIPAYTAKTILGIVDWGLSVQEAVNFPNIIARGETVRVEVGVEPGPALAQSLQADGYNVSESEGENSGLHVIVVREEGLEGAADPRRLGNVMTSAPD